MNSKIAVILLFVSVLFIVHCGVSLYVPSAMDAQQCGTSLDTLMAGRQIYINHCGSCHNLYLPERFSSSEWLKSLGKMQKKAKINDVQQKIILKYLTANKRQISEIP